jgi:hypothetical protein
MTKNNFSSATAVVRPLMPLRLGNAPRRQYVLTDRSTWHDFCFFFHVSSLFSLGADNPSRRQASATAAAESGKILPLHGDGRLTRLTKHVAQHRGNKEVSCDS